MYLSGLPKNDTTITIDGISTLLRPVKPENKKGSYLLLHGWNLPTDDRCNKTGLYDSNLSDGYCIVLPDLGKSNYQ